MWKTPPTVDALQAAIDALPDAFDLEGDGPRFFQDQTQADFIEVEPKPIEFLLIDSPGENGAKRNADLFVKRDRIRTMSRPLAAMALITMQSYAPAGGPGFRTSMRGGGPLTTLIEPRTEDEANVLPLWCKLWVNVETIPQTRARTPAEARYSIDSAFPWLQPTRTSDPTRNGITTTPADVHPLQAYFGLPRRVRLEFAGAGRCDLSALDDARTVTGFRARQYGMAYDGWRHPLSPYYKKLQQNHWIPVHGQPKGTAWDDWIGFVLGDSGSHALQRAFNVSNYTRERSRIVGSQVVRLHVFGYDMDKFTARGWIDAVLPVFTPSDEERQTLLYAIAHSLVEATRLGVYALIDAMKIAVFGRTRNTPGGFGQAKLDLWAETERDFYAAVRAVADESLDPNAAAARVEESRRAYAPMLERAATAVFDRWCPAGGLDVVALRRRVDARYQLTLELRGYRDRGEDICQALGIAPPGGGRALRAAKKVTSKKEKAR